MLVLFADYALAPQLLRWLLFDLRQMKNDLFRLIVLRGLLMTGRVKVFAWLRSYNASLVGWHQVF